MPYQCCEFTQNLFFKVGVNTWSIKHEYLKLLEIVKNQMHTFCMALATLILNSQTSIIMFLQVSVKLIFTKKDTSM